MLIPYNVHHPFCSKRKGKIRTNDIHFIRRDHIRLSYLRSSLHSKGQVGKFSYISPSWHYTTEGSHPPSFIPSILRLKFVTFLTSPSPSTKQLEVAISDPLFPPFLGVCKILIILVWGNWKMQPKRRYGGLTDWWCWFFFIFTSMFPSLIDSLYQI